MRDHDEWAGIAGFQIVPRPDPLPTAALAIQSSGTHVTLSWPDSLGSVVLQESTHLQTWAPTASPPVTNSIVISIETTPRFFRLARP
jgi:hypothetical protein